VESQYLDGERLVFGSVAAVDGQRRRGAGPVGDQPKPATRWSRSTPPSNPPTPARPSSPTSSRTHSGNPSHHYNAGSGNTNDGTPPDHRHPGICHIESATLGVQSLMRRPVRLSHPSVCQFELTVNALSV
jgi:hypothetical protein